MATLKNYIEAWQKDYSEQSLKVPLFQNELTGNFSLIQKQKFVRHFYHIRGHFYKFLWLLGSTATGSMAMEMKKVILENISEEFGRQKSHEQMYFDFANSLEVELIQSEVLDETSNVSFIKEFNQSHLEFILNNQGSSAWAAFSAYEALDNLDYVNLLSLVSNWNLGSKAMTFYKVHAIAAHHQTTESILQKIWEDDQESVKKSFTFIAGHQLKMWQNLYNQITE